MITSNMNPPATRPRGGESRNKAARNNSEKLVTDDVIRFCSPRSLTRTHRVYLDREGRISAASIS